MAKKEKPNKPKKQKKIASVKPVTIEPTEVTNFPDLFLSSLLFSMQADGNGEMRAKLLPYNHEDDTLAPNVPPYRLLIDNLAAERERVPELGVAIDNLITVIASLTEEKMLAEEA